MWIACTQLTVVSLIERLAGLIPEGYLENACLDSCVNRQSIIRSTSRFGGRESTDSEFFNLSAWAKDGTASSLTGYDEVWLYPQKPNQSNRRIHSLQEFGSDWNFEQDLPPEEFKADFHLSGVLLVISDCGVRNIAAGKRYPIVRSDQWREIE